MRALALAAVVALSGCTTVQQKADAYREAAERFAYPDKLRVCYERDGETKRGGEYRCFGEGCELPPCPTKD